MGADVNMNALKPDHLFRKSIFLFAAITCLRSAQAHPGHEHDGGLLHVASHGFGWLVGIVAVGAVFGLIAWRKSRREGAK
jgi:hypothetical protein